VHFRSCIPGPRFISAMVVLAILHTPPIQAQSTADADQAQLIQRLQKRIDDLETSQKAMQEKIENLSAAPVTAAPAVEAPAPPPSPPPEAHEHTMKLPGGGPALKIRAFADFNLGLGSDANPLIFPLIPVTGPGPIHNTFQIGEFDLFLSSRLSSKVSAISEIVIGTDPTNVWGLDIERLQITYKANPYFAVSGGRYHTAIGYYNTAFHHGTWFQTATGRPFIYFFEDSGGILPVHSVGITATGLVPHTGRLELYWIAAVGNGRSSDPSLQPVQNFLSDKNHKSVNFAWFVKPQWISGWQIGGSYYRDRLVPANVAHVDEGIASLYAVYTNSPWEWLNEALWLNHKMDGAAKSFNSPLSYTQISRKFGVYRPYFRFQYINVPTDDPVSIFTGRYEGPSAGLRMDFTEYAALKVQYNRLYQRGGRLPENGVDMQVAFTY
jgi:hypothetical protein